jgi:hypothetical protein
MHWGQPLARVEDSGGYPLPAWPAPGWCRRMAGLLLALVDAGLARWTARDGRRWSQQAYYGMQRRLSMWVQDRRQREGFAPSCGRPATLLMATGKLNITVCFLSSVSHCASFWDTAKSSSPCRLRRVPLLGILRWVFRLLMAY